MEGTVITMPAVALRGLTVFPAMMIHFDINRKRSVAAVEKAMVSDQKVFLVTQRQPEVVEPGLPDLYQVGTIALVKQMVKLPGGNIRVMVEGLKRAELLDLDSEDPMLMVRIEELELQEEEDLDPIAREAMCLDSEGKTGGVWRRFYQAGQRSDSANASDQRSGSADGPDHDPASVGVS